MIMKFLILKGKVMICFHEIDIIIFDLILHSKEYLCFSSVGEKSFNRKMKSL